MHENVRVVVGLLSDFGHAVDEGDRRGEIIEFPLAHDLVGLASPLTSVQSLRDVVIAQKFCHIVGSSSNSQLPDVEMMVPHSFAIRDPERA
jgi:hypothetical protein